MEISTFTIITVAAIAIVALLLAGAAWVWAKRVAIKAAHQARQSAVELVESGAQATRRVVALTVSGRESARAFGQMWVQPLRTQAIVAPMVTESTIDSDHTARRPGFAAHAAYTSSARNTQRVSVLR
jgi:hypothetical protein